MSAMPGAPLAPDGFDAFMDKQSGNWHYEDGEEEYEFVGGKWNKLESDQLPNREVFAFQEQVSQQQAAYAIDGVDAAEPVEAVQKRMEKKRAKDEGIAQVKIKPKIGRGNTAVYVTGLQQDVTRDDVIATFEKFGLLLMDPEGPKVKLYSNSEGVSTGEALIVYAAQDSATQAINIMDGMEFTPSKGDVIQVAMADFSQKNGSQQPVDGDQIRKKKKTAKVMEEKKAVWALDDVDDGFGPTVDTSTKEEMEKNERTVVLQHMFTIAELQEDASQAIDIKDDVREECEANFGSVTAIHIYEEDPRGVVTVKFKDAVAALACVARNDGRMFAGRKIAAFLSDGSERFGKSTTTDDDEKARLNDFGNWLEQ